MTTIKNIIDTFKIQVKQVPNHLAIIDGTERITYRQLDDLSDRLAVYLKRNMKPTNRCIGIFLDRSIEQIVSILAIIKAGFCYLPLDITYPEKRLKLFLDNSKVNCIISSNTLIGNPIFRNNTRKINILQISKSFLNELPKQTLDIVINIESPAYVLYTSGSTGIPKGIVMPHNSLTNLILKNGIYNFPLKTLQFSSISFDVSFQEIFSTLCFGGTLFLISDENRKDPEKLAEHIKENKIERIFFPFVALNHLIVYAQEEKITMPSLMFMVTAGEQLRITQSIRDFFKKHKKCTLINQYGPSETHVVTEYVLPKQIEKWEDLPPIGHAVKNVSAIIVDSKLTEVPSGQEGELLITGDCLALGYLNDIEKTNERFIEIHNKRFYKTGDLAQLEKDGQIHFLGRIDRQVKIRGYRIELHEIEKIIEENENIKSCITKVVDIKDQKIIVAYVILNKKNIKENSDTFLAILHRELKEKLPEYMLPHSFIIMDKFPLTPSGKVDLNFLPDPSMKRPLISAPYMPAITKNEKILEKAWKETLLLEKIGIDDAFFEIGGNSLLLAILRSKIQKLFKTKIIMADLFEHYTIRKQALFLEKKNVSHEENHISKMFDQYAHKDIAIVGMACRFPGAKTADFFWDNLLNKRETISTITNCTSFITEQAGYIKRRGILEDIDTFDADFWGYTTKEATYLDPQHRLFMECAWEAIEDAGYNITALKGQVGVFAGGGMSSYLINHLISKENPTNNKNMLETVNDLFLSVSADRDYMPAKVSYKLNLKGPSINCQAACSTSLAAIDIACRSIITGECHSAIVGASVVMLPQESGYLYEPDMFFSKDGVCRAFDENASGTVFSNGCGVVYLKLLEDAIKDGDNIYSVIKGTSVNNDGSDKIGFYGTNPSAQNKVIRDALQIAKKKNNEISYIETHGTATELGDMIELKVLNDTYLKEKNSGSIFLGSVKNNIGHLGWASGIASLIKTSLILYHKKIPPTINFTSPKDEILIQTDKFKINTETVFLQKKKIVAGVSSLGLGGNNAHVILENHIHKKERPYKTAPYIFVLSAKNTNALNALVDKYIRYLTTHKNINMYNFVFTASVGRSHFDKRIAFVFETQEELLQKLEQLRKSNYNYPFFSIYSLNDKPISKIAFLFTGQGCQYLEMAQKLYEQNTIFKKFFDKCDRIVHKIIKKSIKDIVFKEKNGSLLNNIQYLQPIIFSVEYSLFQVYKSMGILPQYLLGHSLGEYTAACIAGVFDLKTGLEIVSKRGQLMDKLPKNSSMIAVHCSFNKVEKIYEKHKDNLSIAAKNSPLLTVFSGPNEIMQQFIFSLKKDDIEFDELNIATAGHSKNTELILDEYKNFLSKYKFSLPNISLVSNLTGKIENALFASAQYWVDQTRNTVQFEKCTKTLDKEGVQAYIEISPKPSLLNMCSETIGQRKNPPLFVATLRPKKDDLKQLATAIGILYTAGYSIKWEKIYAGKRLHLPTYPFQRKKYWIEAQDTKYAPQQPKTGLDHLYHVTLKKIEEKKDSLGEPATFLFITDDSLLDVPLMDAISRRGHHVIKESTSSWKKAIRKERPSHIVFLPSSTLIKPLNYQDKAVQNSALLSDIIKVCTEEKLLDLNLYIITSGVYTKQPIEQLASAYILGVSKTIGIEYPEYNIVKIDIDNTSHETLALLSEDLTSCKETCSIIYQNGVRYEPILSRFEEKKQVERYCFEGKIYLITGGLGGISTYLSRWLISQKAKKVILLGRRQIKGKDADMLRSEGIEYISCDVTNKTELSVVFKENQIDGILHLAGVIDDATIQNIEKSNYQNVYAPKIQGTIYISEAIKKYCPHIDFCVLFSSATGLTGNAGQANHAGACTFLDYYANYQNLQGIPTIAIDWGVWGESGKISDNLKMKKNNEITGFIPITNQDGMEALTLAIFQRVNHLAYIPIDWNTYLNATHQQGDPFFREMTFQENKQNANNILNDLSSVMNNVQKTNIIQKYIDALLSIYIDVDFSTFNKDDSIFKHGIDSLSAIEIRNRIQNDLNIRLQTNFISKNATYNKITQFLIDVDYTKKNLSTQKETSRKNVQDDYLRHPTAQQKRWFMLNCKDYGQRVVPLLVYKHFDKAIFMKSIMFVLSRHETLRYKFRNIENIELVDLKEDCFFDENNFIDLRNVSPDEQENEISKIYDCCRKNIPHPVNVLPWKMHILILDEQKFSILLSIQHIEFDGKSLSVFAKDFFSAYEAFMACSEPALSSSVQYNEYADWQQHYIEHDIHEDRAFFSGLFMTLPETSYFQNHPGFKTTTPLESKRYTSPVCLGLWKKIEIEAKKKEISPFTIILSAYALTITDILKTNDVVISIINSGRSNPVFKDVIGPFTAPFPIRLNTKMAFEKLTQQCKNMILAINSRSAYPVSDLIENVPAFSDFPIDTYFSDFGINFTNYSGQKEKQNANFKILEILGAISEPGFSKINTSDLNRIPGLHLVVNIKDDEIYFNFWYHNHRITEDIVCTWSNLFTNHLLTGLAE